LSDATVARFGRIDVWVNSAGVIVYGEFLEIPPDVFKQVIDTNLMGQVHGARAALRHFRAPAC
jgi:NAD(P)-dependent dehydrogenase (short-subunit alcohol dehydrogenase family)